jgi:hypothetical protein
MLYFVLIVKHARMLVHHVYIFTRLKVSLMLILSVFENLLASLCVYISPP